jgi:hypothetical protein
MTYEELKKRIEVVADEVDELRQDLKFAEYDLEQLYELLDNWGK